MEDFSNSLKKRLNILETLWYILAPALFLFITASAFFSDTANSTSSLNVATGLIFLISIASIVPLFVRNILPYWQAIAPVKNRPVAWDIDGLAVIGTLVLLFIFGRLNFGLPTAHTILIAITTVFILIPLIIYTAKTRRRLHKMLTPNPRADLKPDANWVAVSSAAKPSMQKRLKANLFAYVTSGLVNGTLIFVFTYSYLYMKNPTFSLGNMVAELVVIALFGLMMPFFYIWIGDKVSPDSQTSLGWKYAVGGTLFPVALTVLHVLPDLRRYRIIDVVELNHSTVMACAAFVFSSLVAAAIFGMLYRSESPSETFF